MMLMMMMSSNYTIDVCRAADELQNEAKAHILHHVNVVMLHAMIFEPQHYGIVLELVPRGCLEGFIDQYKVAINNKYVALLLCNCAIINIYRGFQIIICILASTQHFVFTLFLHSSM